MSDADSALIVIKFGGTALGSPARIRRAAARVAAHRRAGESVVVVVSATGHTTDRILHWLRALGACGTETSCRESERALATGEDLASAYLAFALDADGVPAVSLRGGEAGLLAAGPFGAARLFELAYARLRDLLAMGVVPVVAGFQGVRSDGETVTLGRGGSDTSAVFLAAALAAQTCHIVTDVRGVYDRDPRRHASARLIRRLSHRELVRLTESGAHVVHPDAASLAARHGTPLHIYGYRAPIPARTKTVVAAEAIHAGRALACHS